VIAADDNRAYLLATSPGPTAPQWWVAGVDADNGQSLFRPVPLNATAAAPSCFVNGRSLVCLSDEQSAATAWVIDRQTGTLDYSGPTDVRLATGELKAIRAGNHLVAATSGEGVYGIGSKAETTWFQPGIGKIGYHNGEVAVQASQDKKAVTMFSLEDGRTVQAEFPDGAQTKSMTFFEGGFAAQFADEGQSFTQFFDAAGKLAGDERVTGMYIGGATGNLTAVVDADGVAIYGPTGEKLFQVAGEAPHGLQLMGTTLWIGEASNSAGSRFRPFDMRTGDPGTPCDFDAVDGYLGNDGSSFVRAPTNPKSDELAKAYDLATCELNWTIPRSAGSLGSVSRIGDTLVRLSDDGTGLTSLVPPR
jgi:hypothetical protein